MLFLCWTCHHLRGFRQHNITVRWRAVVSWAESQRRSSRTSQLHQTPTAPPLGGGPTGVHQAFFRLSPAVAPGWAPGDLVLGGVHCTLDFLVITGSLPHTEAETRTQALLTEPCFITETLPEISLFLNTEDVESRNTSALLSFTSLLFHFPPSAFTLEANAFILYKLQHADHLQIHWCTTDLQLINSYGWFALKRKKYHLISAFSAFGW